MRGVFIGVLLTSLTPTVAYALSNVLAGHPSPYLAMHADDPVHWQSWSETVIDQARREDKLMYISSGYFSCHWCHVMQRESYKDAEIAKVLNRTFIPIKIDRELEPVLDAKLLDFVQATRGHGGWPLNVFMTPEGYPLVGVLYMPPGEFKDFLHNLDVHWQREKNALKEIAAKAAQWMARRGQSEQQLTADVKVSELEQEFLTQALLAADEMAGGFGQVQKFPSTPQLTTLLFLYQENQDPRLQEFLVLTLEQMANKGLRDQLGGGFYRYTVDPDWDVPHFEKMLYDNAQLVEVYLVAADTLARPDFQRIAFDTLDFMLQHMHATGGAFVASLSAVNAAGEEGAYYLWQRDELKQILNREDGKVAELAWGFNGTPTMESGYLPVRTMSVREIAAETGLTESQVRKHLASVRERLLKARARRTLPRDDKRLASWNGLMLSALSHGAMRDEARYGAAARRLRDFIVAQLWVNGDLQRAVDSTGRSLGAGNLEDYAFAAKGLLAWADFTRKEENYALAATLMASAWSRFYSDKGWRTAQSSMIPNPTVSLHLRDSAVPSPSATLVEASLAVIERPELRPHHERIERYVTLITQSLATQPFFHATQVALLSRYAQEKTVTPRSR